MLSKMFGTLIKKIIRILFVFAGAILMSVALNAMKNFKTFVHNNIDFLIGVIIGVVSFLMILFLW